MIYINILIAKLSDLADGVATFGYIGATFIAVSFLFKQIILDNNYDINRIRDYLSPSNWQVMSICIQIYNI